MCSIGDRSAGGSTSQHGHGGAHITSILLGGGEEEERALFLLEATEQLVARGDRDGFGDERAEHDLSAPQQ